jgi:hypothetical protein
MSRSSRLEELDRQSRRYNATGFTPQTECTMPCLESTPMCAFMPKNHCLPLRVWCISGSRLPLALLVDEGA